MEPYRIEARGEVVWADAEGRMGIKLSHMPDEAERRYTEWLDVLHAQHEFRRRTEEAKAMQAVRDTSYGAGGLGSLVKITNGNVLDIQGNILLPNECGVYRNVAYFLVDQNTPPQTIQGNYTLVEHFTNYTTSVNGLRFLQIWTIRSFTRRYGKVTHSSSALVHRHAPGTNDHEGFDQHLTVKLDSSHSYGLSIVNHIDRGSYSGTAAVNVTITTP